MNDGIHHTSLVTKTFLIAIVVWQLKTYCSPQTIMNKLGCHQMASYDFGHYWWIKSIFGCHLGIIIWRPNFFWPSNGD